MFVCKSMALANYLIQNGLKCEKIDEDRTNVKYLVFLFKKSPKWNDLMMKWTELTRK